ncbi:hypothetical protein [Burkholderia ubonensis]|uniref:hypothetical protein n=1 Tax=Burkholderia ubonensis TaxID=101571 RepID=UPI000A671331|nr:hypothetical protein [Burkholderia ubonensis]
MATAPGTPLVETIGGLGELVAKSLLSVEFRGARAQYRLTESARAYALEKLRDAGEFERVAACHARHEREQWGVTAVVVPAGAGPASQPAEGGERDQPAGAGPAPEAAPASSRMSVCGAHLQGGASRGRSCVRPTPRR